VQPYYSDKWVTIYHGDCREILPALPKVDLVLTDPPYGVTQNEWDTEVEDMWEFIKPLVKGTGCCVFSSMQPFTSKLVTANLSWFKWEQIWHKTRSTGHLNAKIMPLREHENILIFAPNKVKYNPIITKKDKANIRPYALSHLTSSYGEFGCKQSENRTIALDESYPRSVIVIDNINQNEWGLHPTQKPTELFDYLISTYSDADNLILDPFLGSGTTCYCAKKLNRYSIGIEIEEKYCEIAAKRCSQEVMELVY
jgi:site-specific DNA-methyltransferase (adenine-specific)